MQLRARPLCSPYLAVVSGAKLVNSNGIDVG